MPDSDIPSVHDDDDDEDEATLMWNREDFEADGELIDPSRLKEVARASSAGDETDDQASSAPRTGLDEEALFADVLEPESQQTPGEPLPVQPMVTQGGQPAIGLASDEEDASEERDTSEVEPVKVSMVSSSATRPRTGLWAGVAMAVIAVLGAGAYLFWERLAALWGPGSP